VRGVNTGIVEVTAQESDIIADPRMQAFGRRPIGYRIIRPGPHTPKAALITRHSMSGPRFKAGDAVRVAGGDNQQAALFAQCTQFRLVPATQVTAGFHNIDQINKAGQAFNLMAVYRSDKKDYRLLSCRLVHIGRRLTGAGGGVEVCHSFNFLAFAISD